MSKTYDIETVIHVTDEQVDDVLVTCFEGGSTSWITEVTIDQEPTEPYKYMSDVLTRGGTLHVQVEEEDMLFTLTLEKFLEGLGKSTLDFDNYDALDADEALQYAVFGEVIYG